MAKGDGSIIRRGRDVWEVQVSFGRNPVTGRYEKASRTVHGTKAEARRVRDGMRREREGGLSVESARATFGEFASQWLKVRESSGSLSKISLSRDGSIVRLLCGYIGDVKLCDLTPSAIDKLYSRIREDKISKLGHYSETSMHHIHRLLKAVLNKAVCYDLLMRNPCDRVEAPKVEDPNRRALSRSDAARLLDAVDGAIKRGYEDAAAREWGRGDGGDNGRIFARSLSGISNALAARVAIMTGARRGEVYGLTWGCVDPSANQLRICQSLSDLEGIKKPKTKAGNRTIHVDGETMAALEVWRIFQASALEMIGVAQAEGTPVFCNDRGGFMNMSNAAHWWKRFCDAEGFGGLRFHELRHTHATLLMAASADVKTVQTRLGHASANITLNWYAHAVQENDRAAADCFNMLLGRAEKQ